jgi:alpha-amylase/alpha-mannosidase (GH57 family)
MERYICIHGHFYQPPRENPWLEAIELQDSAYPYHDWNERITAECYAPNSVSRILNGQNQIVKLVNNYSTISFNFGPTLLSWLQSGAPEQIDIERAVMLLETMRIEGVAVDGSTMEFAFRRNLERMASRLAERPTDLSLLRNLDNAANLFPKLPFAVDKWQVQNEYCNLLKNTFSKMRHGKGRQDELAQAWRESFVSLGRKIGVHMGETTG